MAKITIELLFNIANISFLIGTILLTRRIIKNRNVLRDFDAYGSSLNVIGMTITVIALVELRFYTTIIISLPTLMFWTIASIYSFRNNKYRKKINL